MSAASPPEPRMRVVVPARNCVRWVPTTMRSIRAQQGVDFRCVFIDDASTDGTFEKAQEIAAGDDRIEVIQNPKQMRELVNRIEGIKRIATEPEDVVVLLDGDDWFSSDDALARLAAHYRDPRLWASHGSYRSVKRRLRDRLGIPRKASSQAYPPEVHAARSYRQVPWKGCHPMTFRRFLFDQLGPRDYYGPNGTWWLASTDQAMLFPIMELASQGHFRHLPEVFYIYNKKDKRRKNPEYEAQQRADSAAIRALPPREPLQWPPANDDA